MTSEEQKATTPHRKIHRDPTPAILCLQGFAGYTESPVTVIGETPRKYRIIAKVVTKLAGRMRFLHPGEETLIPKTAVRLNPKEDEIGS